MNWLSFDIQAAEYITSHRTPELISFFSHITVLGDSLFVLGLSIALALGLTYFAARGVPYALALGIVVSGATLTKVILKDIVGRARPELPLIFEPTFSFPSGHASVAAALYGFLIYVVWQYKLPPLVKYAALIIGLGLIALIGFSRMYLGVHFPSDILAGYLVGAIWVALGAHVVRLLRKKTF